MLKKERLYKNPVHRSVTMEVGEMRSVLDFISTWNLMNNTSYSFSAFMRKLVLDHIAEVKEMSNEFIGGRG